VHNVLRAAAQPRRERRIGSGICQALLQKLDHCMRRRSILSRVKILSRLFTASNLEPSMAMIAFVRSPFCRTAFREKRKLRACRFFDEPLHAPAPAADSRAESYSAVRFHAARGSFTSVSCNAGTPAQPPRADVERVAASQSTPRPHDFRKWDVSPMAAPLPSADVAAGGDCGAHSRFVDFR